MAPGDRVCLVVGAENAGVCQALLDASDATVHIPMRGHNSSMNVANACAIATYEIARRLAPERQAGGSVRPTKPVASASAQSPRPLAWARAAADAQS